MTVGIMAGIGGATAPGQAVNPVNVGGGEQGKSAALQPTSAPADQVPAATGAPPATAAAAVSSVTPGETPAATAPATTLPTVTTGEQPAVPATGNAETAPASTAPAVAATETSPPAALPKSDLDGPAYRVSAMTLDYFVANPKQPPLAEIMNQEVELGIVDGAYVNARPGVQIIRVKISEIGKGGPDVMYLSAIKTVEEEVVRWLNNKSIIGVFVAIDPKDVDSTGKDLRGDRTSLDLKIVTATVSQVRTVELGQTTNPADRVDTKRHAFVRDNSPIKAATGAPGEDRVDLLKKDDLDDYVLRLNRQAGRRVDVAVSGTGEAGKVYLDYLVAENRPWYAYVQGSNTGTAQTSVWRERFGFVDNQLTNHDDTLSLDYSTSNFDQSNAVTTSYEFPLFSMERLRGKVFTSWNQYTASDVGQTLGKFNGQSWNGGGEAILNVFQYRQLFVDLAAGVQFLSDQTEDNNGTVGHGNFSEPYLSLRAERATDIMATTGALTIMGMVTSDSQASVDALGRFNTSRDAVVLQFDFAHSFYLEPLVDATRFADGSSTLAHEIYLSTHGQYAFQARLTPSGEEVAGGLYSVRGYPESVVAGDSVIVATAEYRLHIPRLLPIQSDPSKTPFLWDKSFRFSPQQRYDKPDWDFIVRTFFDVGQVDNSRPVQSFEHNVTLMGTGLGAELLYKQNFDIRVDWGVALTDVPTATAGADNQVTAGSNRFHISATLLY
jgi:hemolysin activation/secretion protein